MDQDDELCEGCVCNSCSSCDLDDGNRCRFCPCDDCYFDHETGKMTEFRIK